MNSRRVFSAAFLLATVFALFSLSPGSATAQESVSITRTYKVQVQYWFFDTDYYYWSTKLETTNQSDAQFLYGLLVWAKENGQLNAVVPNSYWRYIAVDVRMRVEYDWNWVQPQELQLSPLRF